MARITHALTAVLVLALVLLSATATASAQPSQEAVCPDVGRFAVGGYPRPDLVPAGYEAVPTPGGIFGHESRGYNHGQTVGAANMVAAVDRFAAVCPSSPVHLYGHSYGAAIVSTAAETINARWYAARVHVHVTGNPRHPGGVEDTYRGWIAPGITFRGPVNGLSRLASYRSDCNYGRDIICHAPHPLLDIVGNINAVFGYLGSGHVYSAPTL